MSVTRRSPHGERGLKSRHLLTISATRGRSPHGERGLKYASAIPKRHVTMSLSSWRAWIEMNCSLKPATNCLGRSPHGERGLKSNAVIYLGAYLGRSPHGERGLKCAGLGRHVEAFVSLSSWRAWIEISDVTRKAPDTGRSLSSWRAWIEMAWKSRWNPSLTPVALLMESVD